MELMFSLAKSVMIHGRVDSINEVYSQIDRITVHELEGIAKKFFSIDNVAQLIYKF
jgi:hypothetical protein